MTRRLAPTTWPLWLVLVVALAIRLALIAIDGSGYDIEAFQQWTRQMLAHPLDQFYADDLEVPQDHLPGDLWALYALGNVWTWLGGGAFAGTGAAMIALKLVAIALDLVLAVVAAAIVRSISGDRAARLVLLAVVFNPGVIFISAIWGQWNVLASVLIAVAALLILRHERAGVGLGLPVLAYATLVKPQFLVLLVPVAVLLARRWRAGAPPRLLAANVVLGGAASVLLVLAAILPFDVGFPGMGMRWTIVERVQFAADRYTTVTKGAYNAWTLVFPDDGADDRLTWLGVTYQQIGFVLLALATIYAVAVGWRSVNAAVGMVVAMAIVTAALFMVVTRSHERYLIDGAVLTIVAAGLVPRLRPAAWALSAGLLLNMWFGWGYWQPAWVANVGYTDGLYRALASVNMIGFGLLLWGAWPRTTTTTSSERANLLLRATRDQSAMVETARHDASGDIPMTDARDRVRAQYGKVGDAYVTSKGHASGNDLERMLALADPKPTDTLLDIATGGGHVARVIGPHAGRVIASDLTPEMLDHAIPYLKGQGIENVERLVADAQDLPLDEASVDIVTCRIAPHHFPDPAAFVAEVARVLRPGGRFLLVDSTVPDGPVGEFFNAYETVRDPSHERSLTEAEWIALLEQHGLTIDAVEPFRKRHEFGDWTDRMQVSEADKSRLQELMLGAGEEVHRTFEVAFDPNTGAVDSWVDTKTLFASHRG